MKQLTLLLITIGFFSLLIGANIYMAKRFAFYFSFDRTALLYLAFAVVTIFMIGGTLAFINATSSLGSITFGVAAILLGFMLYLLISMLVVDLLGLAVDVKPIWRGIAAFSIATIISVYGMWNATHLQVTNVTIPLKNLQKPVKAVHLTDTHLGHFRGGENLQKIVCEINTLDPEVVFFTGDLLDSKIQLKPESMIPLKNLKAPIYFVEGNHDEYTGVDAIKQYLRSIGVNVLENEITQWGELQIIGLTYMLPDSATVSPHASPNGPNIKNVLEKMNPDSSIPTVLLHHGPDGIGYANKAGVDLYLAGHTHGGQMWPATYISNLIFDYNKGLHDYKGTKIYVSEGTGTFGPPMRVGTKSELTVLNLIPSEQ